MDDSNSPEPRGRRDQAWAAGVGLVAFAVYLRTLAPGLTNDPDTALFQFIGRVLGVPHNPGYPLYVLLTHAFSYLPIGSLAYRINLFSAMFGAAAVSLLFLIARRLECRQVVSAAAALAFALGQVFWSQAVIAEVYTLNASIVAGVLLALLVWSRTMRARWYFTAVAIFAGGLGHHTTIVCFAPGILLFVLLEDRAFVLRFRTLAATACILALGLSQYLFILLRSSQPDAYVESPASTLGGLAQVMMGGQFQDRLFGFGMREVLAERLPAFVRTIFLPDLTVVGLTLAAVGALWLAVRRPRQAILLISGGAAIVCFALNYSVVDTPVFLIPSLLIAWVVAAVGAERVTAHLSRRTAAAAASLFLVVPAWLAATNFADSDRSRDVLVATTLDRVLTTVPEGSALVEESFLVNRMVTSRLQVDDRPRRQSDVALVSADPRRLRARAESGVPVFAFPKTAEQMRFEGLDVSFAPLPLIEGSLDRFLWRLPDDSTVAIAVPAVHAGAFLSNGGTSMRAIGAPTDLSALAGLNIALVGVRGRPGADIRSGRSDVALAIGNSHSSGENDPAARADVDVRADRFEAAIRQGGRELVRSSEGIVVAVWKPGGSLLATYVLQAATFGVPIPAGPLSVYRLRGASERRQIGDDDWSDLSSCFRTGSVVVRLASGDKVVFYLADDQPLAPRAISSTGRSRVTVSSGSTVAAVDVARELEDAYRSRFVGDAMVYRVEFDAIAGAVSVRLATGGIPGHAIGRVTRATTSHGRADIFQEDTRGLLRSPDRRSEMLLMGRDAQAQLIGDGWSDVDRDAAGPFRWTTGAEARLVLPVSSDTTRLIRVQALSEGRGPSSAIALRVNGERLASQPLQSGWHVYEWAVPPGRLRPGINEASVVVDGNRVAVSDVRVIHDIEMSGGATSLQAAP